MSTEGKDQVASLRNELADELVGTNRVETDQIEAAFRDVPRHLFVPGTPYARAYSDESVITKRQDGIPISSSSQPAIMAVMLEQLALEPGHRVLEIGAGTGYNAALMKHIVGESGRVVTIDIDEDLVMAARHHLSTAGFDGVEVMYADGGYGNPSAAPYDRIILTVGAWDIAPAWHDQLNANGRLLVPLSIAGSVRKSIVFRQVGGNLVSTSVKGCGFMPIRGAFAGPQRTISLGPEPGLNLDIYHEAEVDAEDVYSLLNSAISSKATGVSVEAGELEALGLWISLREQDAITMWAEGELADRTNLPGFVREGGWKAKVTGGFLRRESLALLDFIPTASNPAFQAETTQQQEIHVRIYGPATSIADRLIELCVQWEQAGRPSTDIRSIKAYPSGSENRPSRNESTIPKKWTKLLVDWQDSTMGMGASLN